MVGSRPYRKAKQSAHSCLILYYYANSDQILIAVRNCSQSFYFIFNAIGGTEKSATHTEQNIPNLSAIDRS